MTLYDPFFKFLNPRNSGLIVFKGGGDGASASEVETIVTDATAPIVTAGNAINANLGTATEGGVVQATGGSMTMPTTSIDPDTGEVITGTKTVDYGGGDVAVTEDLIIRNFLGDGAVDLPTEESMNNNPEQFVIDTYKKIFNREPNEYEIWFVKDCIEKDSSVTPLVVYYSLMTSNEYRQF